MAEVLTLTQVAARFGVSSQTVRAWDKEGILKSFRTPGGHRRFRSSDVEELLRKGGAHDLPETAA